MTTILKFTIPVVVYIIVLSVLLIASLYLALVMTKKFGWKTMVAVFGLYWFSGILVMSGYYYVHSTYHFKIEEFILGSLIWPYSLLYVIYPNAG